LSVTSIRAIYARGRPGAKSGDETRRRRRETLLPWGEIARILAP